MSGTTLRDVVERRRVNAAVGWVIVAILLVAAVGALFTDDPVWGVFVLAVAVLAVVPPVTTRHPTAMLPWEVLGLAALPAVGRTLIVGEQFGGITLTGRIATFLAVAAVALVVTVELDAFTTVQMTESFAVVFVGLTTTAAAGVCALARYLADTLFGTQLLLDGRALHDVETALMWDFVAATLVGLVAGVVFAFYFRRRHPPTDRLPAEVTR